MHALGRCSCAPWAPLLVQEHEQTGIRWYNRYQVPYDQVRKNPKLKEYADAIVMVRLNSTTEECDPRGPKRRTTAFRALNPHDPYHRAAAGVRQHVENFFSNYKVTLRNRRARNVTDPRILLDLLGFQAHTMIKALIHHYHENSGSPQPWFGQRAPIAPRPP